MGHYATYINKNGTAISIGDKLRRYMKIKPSELKDIAPKFMQHANSVVNLETGKRDILANDMATIAAAVETY